MEISRRDFLKISGTTAVAFALGCGSEIKPKEDRVPPIDPWVDTREVKYGAETTTICPFCAVGCGIVVTSNWVDGVWKVVNTEGDPDHPINEGTLCSKGSSLYQLPNNERRLSKVLHRAGGATDWEELDWDTAISMIANKIKDTRDSNFDEQKTLQGTSTTGATAGTTFTDVNASFISNGVEVGDSIVISDPLVIEGTYGIIAVVSETEVTLDSDPGSDESDVTYVVKDEKIVNRTDAIGCLGGAALDNEECYLLSKLCRALGLVYIEHQARI